MSLKEKLVNFGAQSLGCVFLFSRDTKKKKKSVERRRLLKRNQEVMIMMMTLGLLSYVFVSACDDERIRA